MVAAVNEPIESHLVSKEEIVKFVFLLPSFAVARNRGKKQHVRENGRIAAVGSNFGVIATVVVERWEVSVWERRR